MMCRHSRGTLWTNSGGNNIGGWGRQYDDEDGGDYMKNETKVVML